MEIDELEQLWKEHDKKLSDNLSLNEKLIKEMVILQSKHENNSIKKFEIFNILIVIIVLFIFIVWMIQFGNEFIFLVSGLVSSLFISISGILTLKRLKILSEFEQYYDSVSVMQRKISSLEQAYYKNKKADLTILPIWVVSFFPIMMKGLAGIDFSLVPTSHLVISMITAIVFAYILAWILFKFGYKEKMKNINALLKKLDEFESEPDDCK